jgi:TonB family protein
MHRGITSGEVQVLVKIGPDQRVQDAYRPERIDGQPVTTLAQLTVRFEVRGLVVIERHASDESPELFIGAFAYQPCNPARLDQPLHPVINPSPLYPRKLRDQGVRGRVVVQYYIDESGRVRMPMVDQADNDVLASLTLQAVEQWQFAPPSSHGRPVLVRANRSCSRQTRPAEPRQANENREPQWPPRSRRPRDRFDRHAWRRRRGDATGRGLSDA